MPRLLRFITITLLLLLILSACGAGAPEAPAESESTAPSVEEPAAEEPAGAEEEVASEGEQAPAATATLPPQPTAAPTPIHATPTPLVEERLVEVEWPGQLLLGDSDVVRMALIPSETGYTLPTEFPEHQTITQDVPVIRPSGYDLYAVARLDGAGFVIVPAAEQASLLPLHQAVTWHWSLTPQQPGRQRLTIRLLLRWEPLAGTLGTGREAVVYSKGLEVGVVSFFGLTRGQALTTALIGLSLGGVMLILGAVYRAPRGQIMRSKPAQDGVRRVSSLTHPPNDFLEIECPGGIPLSEEEKGILRSLFQRYQRLVVRVGCRV